MTELQVITPEMMGAYAAPIRVGFHDGEKFPGSFGFTELLTADYWTLRTRSAQLYKSNLYARGIIRRLTTSIVNTGLNLETLPEERILGLQKDALTDWGETVEMRFSLWSKSPALCDYRGERSFGALQAAAKQAALISGDVLVVLHQDPVTGLPKVRLVDGSRIQDPYGVTPKLPPGSCIRHGVELDDGGRHVAYWIVSDEVGTTERRSQRLPCVGSTGRRSAWLVYGCDRMLDDVRGEPILGILLHSLRDLDRMRDATVRKALLNANLAIFIKRDSETLGTRPLSGGAVLRGRETVSPTGTADKPRSFKVADFIPGLMMEELAPGETPQAFPSTGTDAAFGAFEEAILNSMAWSLEIPPEILRQSFSSNYSASKAAIQELQVYLNVARADFGDSFTQRIYNEFLIAETLSGRVKADGLLEAWRDPSQYDRYAAWTTTNWTGQIKPALDLSRTVEGYKTLVSEGFITRDRAARELTGTKYSSNTARLTRENEALVEANRPLVEAEKAATPAVPPQLKPVPKHVGLPFTEDEDHVLAS